MQHPKFIAGTFSPNSEGSRRDLYHSAFALLNPFSLELRPRQLCKSTIFSIRQFIRSPRIVALIRPARKLSIIGCSTETIRALQARYPLFNFAHHDPPMGFIRYPKAVNNPLEFMQSHPARFVFLAVGSPQQEILARRAASTEGMTWNRFLRWKRSKFRGATDQPSTPLDASSVPRMAA